MSDFTRLLWANLHGMLNAAYLRIIDQHVVFLRIAATHDHNWIRTTMWRYKDLTIDLFSR